MIGLTVTRGMRSKTLVTYFRNCLSKEVIFELRF